MPSGRTCTKCTVSYNLSLWPTYLVKWIQGRGPCVYGLDLRAAVGDDYAGLRGITALEITIAVYEESYLVV